MKRKKTKKYLSIMLALVLALMLAAPAVAETGNAVSTTVESTMENSMEEATAGLTEEAAALVEDDTEEADTDLAEDEAEEADADLVEDEAGEADTDLSEDEAEEADADLAEDEAGEADTDLAEDEAEEADADLAEDEAGEAATDLVEDEAEEADADLAEDEAGEADTDLVEEEAGEADADLVGDETEEADAELAEDEAEEADADLIEDEAEEADADLAEDEAEITEVADTAVPLTLAAAVLENDESIVDKIEKDDDPRKPLIEQGYGIKTEGYDEIYIKQGLDGFIWVPDEDERSEEEIIAEAVTRDKSLADKGPIYVVRGEDTDTVTLHAKNGTPTMVVVKNGILIVAGKISHVTFVGGEAPGEDDLVKPEDPDDDGKVSTIFTLYKYLNEIGIPGEGFVFDIIPVDENGVEGESVGTMTSDADGMATLSILVKPGSYIIREEVDEDLYMPVEDILVTVDSEGNVQYEGDFDGSVTNIQWSGLDISANVLEQYYKEYHRLVYKWYEYDTLVAGINPKQGNKPLPDGIKGDYLGNGMTYLTIDRAALEELGENGCTLTIAQSNKTGNAKKNGTTLWNTVTAGEKTFSLSIQDGQLKLESSLPHFGAAVYPAKGTVNGPKDIKHDEATVYDLPAGDTFKFFIHWENTRYHLDEVIGCELDHKDLESHPYPGSVTMKVTNAEGEVVYDGAVGEVKKLVAGTYTMTILADGAELASDTYTVGVGETATGDFGTLIVWGEDVVAECPYVPAYGPEHGIFPNNPILKK